MREARDGERLLARDDVHRMLLDRVMTLQRETDGNARDKFTRKAQIALLGELLDIDFPALTELTLPDTGRTVYVRASA